MADLSSEGPPVPLVATGAISHHVLPFQPTASLRNYVRDCHIAQDPCLLGRPALAPQSLLWCDRHEIFSVILHKVHM